MPDLFHVMGSDLTVSPTGDLALASGDAEVQQRILRRLLTNLTDYIWHLDYGAGLPGQVGAVADAGIIEGIIVSQMALEAAVVQSPAPGVALTQDPTGNITATVSYTSALTGLPQTLSVPVS